MARDINVYVYGVIYEEGDNFDMEEELKATFGTTSDCIIVDVVGKLLYNNTDDNIQVYAS